GDAPRLGQLALELAHVLEVVAEQPLVHVADGLAPRELERLGGGERDDVVDLLGHDDAVLRRGRRGPPAGPDGHDERCRDDQKPPHAPLLWVSARADCPGPASWRADWPDSTRARAAPSSPRGGWSDHSTISSARISTAGGIASSRVLAVFRLITSS